MKLRTAIKIMRYEEEPWRYRRCGPRYSCQQIREAWKVCERKHRRAKNWMDRDRRVPDLPDDEQLEMRGEILSQLLLGGPLFGEGILQGIVPDDVLNDAREAIQNL